MSFVSPKSNLPIKVLALTRYTRIGASSRLRFYDMSAALTKEGFDVEFQPFFDDDYIHRINTDQPRSLIKILKYYIKRLKKICRLSHYNLIWIEKEVFPWIPLSLERFFLRNSVFIVDYDDAWFHRYDLHPKSFVRNYLKGKLPQLVQLASLTVAGNQYLQQWAEQSKAQSTILLPTGVDLNRYNYQISNVKDKPVIGWMGSPSTSHNLRIVTDILNELYNSGHAQIRLIGVGKTELNLRGERVDWAENQEVEQVQSFDIGIMPLMNEPWNQGKCGYKLIQYMAVGRPVIASPLGINTTLVQHGINGFLAETPEEWRWALNTLLNNSDLCCRMGQEGRRMVEKHYNTALLASKLISHFRTVINNEYQRTAHS